MAPDPVCENCTADEEELIPVWPGGDQAAETPQLWCPECVSRYPNDLAESDED